MTHISMLNLLQRKEGLWLLLILELSPNPWNTQICLSPPVSIYLNPGEHHCRELFGIEECKQGCRQWWDPFCLFKCHSGYSVGHGEAFSSEMRRWQRSCHSTLTGEGKVGDEGLWQKWVKGRMNKFQEICWDLVMSSGDKERNHVCHSCSGLCDGWTLVPFHGMSYTYGKEDDGGWQIHPEDLWVGGASRKRHVRILRTFQLSKEIARFLLKPAPEGSLCLASFCLALHTSLPCCPEAQSSGHLLPLFSQSRRTFLT